MGAAGGFQGCCARKRPEWEAHLGGVAPDHLEEASALPEAQSVGSRRGGGGPALARPRAPRTCRTGGRGGRAGGPGGAAARIELRLRLGGCSGFRGLGVKASQQQERRGSAPPPGVSPSRSPRPVCLWPHRLPCVVQAPLCRQSLRELDPAPPGRTQTASPGCTCFCRVLRPVGPRRRPRRLCSVRRRAGAVGRAGAPAPRGQEWEAGVGGGGRLSA